MQVVASLGQSKKKSELLIIGKKNTDEKNTYDTAVALVLKEEKLAK